MRKSATYGLDVQSDNIPKLKDEYVETRDQLKALAQWYEDALPPILDVGSRMVFDEDEAFKSEQRAMWDRLFEENPGILGDIKKEFQVKIRHLQTLLELPAIKRAEFQHRWIVFAKRSHLGRDPDEGTPAKRALRTASRNTGIQRAIRINQQGSQFYRQEGVTWDDIEKTSLGYANEFDRDQGDLGFGSDKQAGRFDEERERTGTRAAGQYDREAEQIAELEDDDDSYVPISYTRADSEFLYGANSVLAALKAGRRSLHKLYIDPTSQTQETRLRRDQIRQLASDARIPIDTKDQPGKRQVLDKMSQGRPHNGVVLEVSPLPFAPVERIMYNSASESIHLMPQQQAVGTGPPYPRINAVRHDGWRQPFILLLDGILDPGNMGNIIRTAHFYSLTAVAICSNTCAPVGSSVTVKSSSGAIEAIPLINVPFPANFIRNARENDWNVFAAVAPPEHWKQASRQTSTDRIFLTTDTLDFLAQKPAILMLGAEGEGLRSIMMNKATHKISIPGGGRKENDVGVDSLNVASAAAVLIDAMVRNPSSQRAETRHAGRLVTRHFDETRKHESEIQIVQNRDIEGLQDDQEPADEDEETDKEHGAPHSRLGPILSVNERGKLAAAEQIEQIRALKKVNREKIAELKLESRENNKLEIKRLKKENEKHHKTIQEIKARKGSRMNNHDVKALSNMIQQRASKLRAQDALHVSPADIASSRPTKPFSTANEPIIKPFKTLTESSSFEDTPETSRGRRGGKGDSSDVDAAGTFLDSPADVPSPRIIRHFSTAKEPIIAPFVTLTESSSFEDIPETSRDRGREKGDSLTGDAAEPFRNSPTDVPSPRIFKHFSTPKELIIEGFNSPHGSSLFRNNLETPRVRGGEEEDSSFDDAAGASPDLTIKQPPTSDESIPSGETLQRPPTGSEPAETAPGKMSKLERIAASKRKASAIFNRIGV